MTSLALFAQLDEGRGWIWLVVLVAPIVLRLVRWILERLGVVQPETEQANPREVLRRRREERKAAEAEGEDLWKRLARGEVAETPRPRPVPVPVRRTSLDDEAEEEKDVPVPESLEREEEPAALSTIGDARAPAEAPTSLEVEEEPAPLAVLQASPARVSVRVPLRLTRGLGPDDWRRAIVLSEVLGPPVSERQRA